MKNRLLSAVCVGALAMLPALAQAQEGFVPFAGAALGAAGEAASGGEDRLTENINIFDNALSGELNMNIIGPLALGLGAIIAIGSRNNAGSPPNTTR